MRGIIAKTVDEYLASVPEHQRGALEKLRQDIRATVPEAEEVISYGIPCYKYHGLLVGFGAAKNHCSFYSGTTPIEQLREELTAYSTSKGTIRFPADKPLPTALVKKLVKIQMAKNESRKRA